MELPVTMNLKFKFASILIEQGSLIYEAYVCVTAVEYVPSESDAMDNAVLQQWTRNRVGVPTPSAVSTGHRNQYRRVDHLHGASVSLHYTSSVPDLHIWGS